MNENKMKQSSLVLAFYIREHVYFFDNIPSIGDIDDSQII